MEIILGFNFLIIFVKCVKQKCLNAMEIDRIRFFSFFT